MKSLRRFEIMALPLFLMMVMSQNTSASGETNTTDLSSEEIESEAVDAIIKAFKSAEVDTPEERKEEYQKFLEGKLKEFYERMQELKDAARKTKEGLKVQTSETMAALQKKIEVAQALEELMLLSAEVLTEVTYKASEMVYQWEWETSY